MRSVFARFLQPVLLMTLPILTACGGGGGGGGGGEDIGLTARGCSISLVADQNGSHVGAGCDVAWNSLQVTKIEVASEGDRPAWLSVALSGNSSPVRLSASVTDTTLALGRYSTSVRVSAYRGADVLSSISVPVSLQIVAPASPSVSSLTFNMVEGNLPAGKSITLSRSSGTIEIIDVFDGEDWLDASITGSTVHVTLNASVLALDVGTHAAELAINYNGGQFLIPVTLNLNSALNVPGAVEFNITSDSLAADKSKTITIGSNLGGTLSFSAVANKDWLELSPASGDTSSPNNLVVSLVGAKLDALMPGRYTAKITVASTDAGVSAVDIPVTLNYSQRIVGYVSPYEEQSGLQAEVVIRGFGFASVTSPTVSFGGTPAVSFTVVSDTEIRATHPALAQGNYAVQVAGDGGALISRATLVVLDPIAYPSAAISIAGTKRAILYNAERQSIFVFCEGDWLMHHYKFNGSTWGTTSYSTSADLGYEYGGVSISPDGKAIYAISYPYVLSTDPVTHYTTVENGGPGVPSIFHRAAFANDGKLVYSEQWGSNSAIAAYDVTFKSLNTLYSGAYYDSTQRLVAAALDGRRVFVAGKSRSDYVRYYDASTGSLTNSTLYRTVSAVSVDRTGARVVLGRHVYNNVLTLLGYLPASTVVAVITPDGQVAYSYENTGSGLVRKFDLSVASGSAFPEIGSGTALAQSPGANPLMVISGDGETLFIAGDDRVVIQPAP